MHARSALFLLLTSFQWTKAVVATQESANSSILRRQTEQLSPCVTQCFLDIFPEFNCPDLQQCICYNKELQAALGTCVLSSGCSIADALVSQRVQAETCGFPVRDRSDTFRITQSVLFPLATLTVCLRMLSRSPMSGGAGFGWDDWVVLLCVLPMTGLIVTSYMEVDSGLGQDIYRLSIPMIKHCLMYFYIGNTFYSPVIFGTKISFCLLYLRMWRDAGLAFRRACQVTAVVLGMALISFEFSTIFICTPPSYAWNALTGAKGHCIQRDAQLFTNSAFNIAADFVVLLLPIPKFLHLTMSRGKKAGVLVTFLVGFAVTAVSITQLVYLVRNVGKISNPTWDYFPIGLWRCTEVYLSMICCCLPMLPGIWQRTCKVVVSRTPTLVSTLWEKTTSLSTSGGRSRIRSTQSDGSGLGHARAEDDGDEEDVKGDGLRYKGSVDALELGMLSGGTGESEATDTAKKYRLSSKGKLMPLMDHPEHRLHPQGSQASIRPLRSDEGAPLHAEELGKVI
ncbi:unnamed protein product [Zymoseptoria tritici ST99CH_1A5]|uniref:CFEM domain-containing protein n=1 Tax=Zymoseptoria tritici ST99CH_1A5 TaxID=1276529 RepID=A0A1Y6LWM1_ZYMTR|nr:unnamed protein product [Zymoseptoria tritici ST99CH_1A5]